MKLIPRMCLIRLSKALSVLETLDLQSGRRIADNWKPKYKCTTIEFASDILVPIRHETKHDFAIPFSKSSKLGTMEELSEISEAKNSANFPNRIFKGIPQLMPINSCQLAFPHSL